MASLSHCDTLAVDFLVSEKKVITTSAFNIFSPCSRG